MRYFIVIDSITDTVVGTHKISGNYSDLPRSAGTRYVQCSSANFLEVRDAIHDAINDDAVIKVDSNMNVIRSESTAPSAKFDITNAKIKIGRQESIIIKTRGTQAGRIKIGDTIYAVANGELTIPVEYMGD